MSVKLPKISNLPKFKVSRSSAEAIKPNNKFPSSLDLNFSGVKEKISEIKMPKISDKIKFGDDLGEFKNFDIKSSLDDLPNHVKMPESDDISKLLDIPSFDTPDLGFGDIKKSFKDVGINESDLNFDLGADFKKSIPSVGNDISGIFGNLDFGDLSVDLAGIKKGGLFGNSFKDISLSGNPGDMLGKIIGSSALGSGSGNIFEGEDMPSIISSFYDKMSGSNFKNMSSYSPGAFSDSLNSMTGKFKINKKSGTSSFSELMKMGGKDTEMLNDIVSSKPNSLKDIESMTSDLFGSMGGEGFNVKDMAKDITKNIDMNSYMNEIKKAMKDSSKDIGKL